MMHRCLLAVITIAALTSAVPAFAQEHMMIPVPAKTRTLSPTQLETFIYRPKGAGPFPVVILSHGSAAGNPKASLSQKDLSTYFVAQGFEVIVPMRRGRGQS